MTTIQIPDELATQIQLGAERAGESNDDFLRQAVLSRLEDLEDLAVATERLGNPLDAISLAELKDRLGLDDTI